MLYDRGPLDLFTDAEIPAAGVLEHSDAIAAAEVAALDGAAGQLIIVGLQLGAAGADAGDGGAALDIAEAAADLDRQPGDVSLDLVAAAAGAEVLSGDLAGLTNEVLGDLTGAAPPQPPIPPMPAQQYDSTPDPEQQAPPPPDPTVYEPDPAALNVGSCFGDSCRVAYRAALGRQILAWTGRDATDAELLNVDRFMGTYGFLSDLALDWLWAYWVKPNLPEEQ
jgi:hypothetical protein